VGFVNKFNLLELMAVFSMLKFSGIVVCGGLKEWGAMYELCKRLRKKILNS
jgi:hypothetical protein